jgi:hypothetical protein
MGAAGVLSTDMSLTRWMDGNLATQGYCLTPEESRRLALGLRFPTAVCLALVTIGVALESAPLLAGLAVIGVVAGLSPRHPFDYVWNHGIRHLVRAPALPPNPSRRRHAFKVATAWLLVVGGLFALGLTAAALVLGVMLLAACGAVTVFNFCVPSFALSLWERRRDQEAVPA